jgi:hypothetical protein
MPVRVLSSATRYWRVLGGTVECYQVLEGRPRRYVPKAILSKVEAGQELTPELRRVSVLFINVQVSRSAPLGAYSHRTVARRG